MQFEAFFTAFQVKRIRGAAAFYDTEVTDNRALFYVKSEQIHVCSSAALYSLLLSLRLSRCRIMHQQRRVFCSDSVLEMTP